MPIMKEIATNEQLMKFLFVELTKDYAYELLTQLTAADKQELASWLDTQYAMLVVDNEHQPLDEFVLYILESCLQQFPVMFPTVYSTLLLSLEYGAEAVDYLDRKHRAVFSLSREPVGAEERVGEFVPVIKQAVRKYLSQHRKQSTTK
jgi:hypothetical protein